MTHAMWDQVGQFARKPNFMALQRAAVILYGVEGRDEEFRSVADALASLRTIAAMAEARGLLDETVIGRAIAEALDDRRDAWNEAEVRSGVASP